MSEFSLHRCLNMQNSASGFRKAITLRYAVALYVSSVLGSGILVLPGLAAKIAGPASLVAWVLLSAASYPFAYTFASLSARKPESGGVYSFAKESLGRSIASMTGWLFAMWFITGAPAVTLIAASYLAFAFPMSRLEVFVVAGLIIFAAFSINYWGIVLSNRVQLAVVAAIVALLLATVVASFHSVALTNFSPFFPEGVLPIGVSAALIFWSYLGYENVSNVAEEFENPKRDFHRSIMLSVLIVSALYVSVALMTVGTLAYKAGGSVAPFAAILSNVLGTYAAPGTAFLAVFIIFGTVNAYMTGMSRVIYSAATDGGFPTFFASLDRGTGAPRRSLMLLSGLALLLIAILYFLNVDLETALLIPSGAAIIIYVVGSVAGIRLLKGGRASRALPWISLLISLAILPFVGIFVSISLAFAMLGLAYSRFSHR
jgi:amino acid efflux transporter